MHSYNFSVPLKVRVYFIHLIFDVLELIIIVLYGVIVFYVPMLCMFNIVKNVLMNEL